MGQLYRVNKDGGLTEKPPKSNSKMNAVAPEDHERLRQFAQQQGITLKMAFTFCIGLLPLRKEREIRVESKEPQE